MGSSTTRPRGAAPAPAPPSLGLHRCPEREGRPPRGGPRSSTALGGLQGQGLCRQGLGLPTHGSGEAGVVTGPSAQ